MIIVVGGALCVASAGAATPLVAVGFATLGTTTAAFGIADAVEGTQDFYYGAGGDGSTRAVNPLRDTLFMGNDNLYNICESVTVTAASVSLPVAAAGTATVKGFARSAFEYGVSGLAGQGSSYLAYKATGDKNIANIANIVGSTVTGSGLVWKNKNGNKTINGLKIIKGKVDGKIPLAEYKKYRVDSVHNIDSDTMTLGKYEPTIRADGTKDFSIPGPGAYTVKAGDTTYFSLGTEWDKITDTYGLDVAGQNMFDYFNKPALDDAINAGKEIRFSHNPEAYGECALKWEWDYLQEKHGYFALEKRGDFWYAIK